MVINYKHFFTLWQQTAQGIILVYYSLYYFVVLAIISIGYDNTVLTKIAETWEHSDIAVR